jgi:hypothetical protein
METMFAVRRFWHKVKRMGYRACKTLWRCVRLTSPVEILGYSAQVRKGTIVALQYKWLRLKLSGPSDCPFSKLPLYFMLEPPPAP